MPISCLNHNLLPISIPRWKSFLELPQENANLLSINTPTFPDIKVDITHHIRHLCQNGNSVAMRGAGWPLYLE